MSYWAVTRNSVTLIEYLRKETLKSDHGLVLPIEVLKNSPHITTAYHRGTVVKETTVSQGYTTSIKTREAPCKFRILSGICESAPGAPGPSLGEVITHTIYTRDHTKLSAPALEKETPHPVVMGGPPQAYIWQAFISNTNEQNQDGWTNKSSGWWPVFQTAQHLLKQNRNLCCAGVENLCTVMKCYWT